MPPFDFFGGIGQFFVHLFEFSTKPTGWQKTLTKNTGKDYPSQYF
jgi:hypothetical protein